MPLVAPISRLSTVNQAPVRRSPTGLSGLAGLLAFAILVVLTSVNWSVPDHATLEGVVKPAATSPNGLNADATRLLVAHQNLTGWGLLHSSSVQD
ncbi:hypothetical protein GH816_06330 [Betaproteobacteria bacterium LSUCC0115]|nr:hypothetical protein [Burkholderiales bacterium LSUCC0115]